MVVGTKVRMLHGMGEGVITALQGDQATVLLNEGLEIPLRLRDLVPVAAREEAKQLEKADRNTAPMLEKRPARMFFVKEGVFLAGIHVSPMLVDFSIVNHTDFELFVLIYKLGRPVNQFWTQLKVGPKSYVGLPGSLPLQEANHLVGLVFQILKFHPEQNEPQPLAEFRLAFSRIEWDKTRRQIPILDKEGYLLQLDAQPVEISPSELREKMLSPKAAPLPGPVIKGIEFREVDLHIEQLRADYGDLPSGEILRIQLEAFDKALDKAITDNVSRLILIHGVGAGVLKQEIHRRLSSHKAVKFFKDARKEKFGYGATEAQL